MDSYRKNARKHLKQIRIKLGDREKKRPKVLSVEVTENKDASGTPIRCLANHSKQRKSLGSHKKLVHKTSTLPQKVEVCRIICPVCGVLYSHCLH